VVCFGSWDFYKKQVELTVLMLAQFGFRNFLCLYRQKFLTKINVFTPKPNPSAKQPIAPARVAQLARQIAPLQSVSGWFLMIFVFNPDYAIEFF